MDDPRSVNRKWWDERAGLHGQDAYYDIAAFLDGTSALLHREVSEVQTAVGRVEGLHLLHFQCHIGLETLSWARLGARVTGLDFSPRAIEKARELALNAGLRATFIEADVQDLPAELAGRFDLVFASEGSLCWIPDIDRWMSSAARSLRPQGHLVLIDGHPILHMIESVDPLTLGAGYQGGRETRYHSPGSYADPEAPTKANETVEYAHGLGEIVTAASRAGFYLETLTEWTDNPRRQTDERFSEMDGTYKLRAGNQDVPCQFSLRAIKSAPNARSGNS